MNNNLKNLLTFAIGTGLGVVAGYLTAPRSGKKTRTIISKEFDKTKNTVEEVASKKYGEAKEAISATIDSQIEKGKAGLEKAKGAFLN